MRGPRRSAINSGEYAVPIDGFSQIIEQPAEGRLLFLSGLTARTADGTIVSVGDIAGQCRQVLTNMAQVLSAAGGSLDDVLQIRTYVTDISTWSLMEPVWREAWGDVWPASTLVEISRLFDERQLIEMEAIACVG